MRPLPFIVLSLSVLTLAACAPRTAQTTVIPGPILEPVQAGARPVRLGVGQDMQLEVSLNGRRVPPSELNWTSSDPRVVSVSGGGLARAATAGQASVRATQTESGRILAEFLMQVTAPPPATPQRLDALTGQVLELTNAARARGQKCGAQNFPPAPPLNSEARLGAAAQAHAADMAARNYFSHVAQDGRVLKARVEAAGYGWRAIAENIAAGQTSAQEVVTGWLNSEGHCRNLMNAEYRELGIGLAQNTGGKRYWVQDFGTR
ncbi:CAP domain-containing protein [Deinococcus marmoris]|uniref:CAP domain-containing protein n=1 Tax=Deinococcus marmoris TaxID=249408 RepID=UPI0009DF8530|nr:CAP domain-containing protein [Deinococcus marmoris]